MLNVKEKFKKINKSNLLIAGVLLLTLLAVFLLWFNYSNSVQSGMTLDIEVYFKGRYRIADGPWMPYVEGEHIPATKGEVVTLEGSFHKRYEGEDLGLEFEKNTCLRTNRTNRAYEHRSRHFSDYEYHYAFARKLAKRFLRLRFFLHKLHTSCII